MRPFATATATLAALFAAACAGGPGANSTGANTSPADTPTHPTCHDWGSRNFFRSASPEAVRECLQAGADPNGPPGLHPLPPLFIAAGVTPHPTVISILVAAGADVDARKWGGLTPLHEAASQNTNAAIVTSLVAAGVNPDAQDRDGIAPLHLAAVYNRNPDVVVALVEAGADPDVRSPLGNTPLHLTWSDYNGYITANGTGMMRQLLGLGADGLARNDLGRIADPTHCGNWQSAIFVRLAVHADFARCLEEGADLDARNVERNTVLHHVAATDSAMTALLLEAGAEVNARNDAGATPLHSALASRNPGTVSALLEAGAEVEAADSRGDTPLLRAAWLLLSAPEEATELALQLLAAGADPNTRGQWGRTPLHLAVDHGSAALVGALLEAGADPGARSLLDVAAWSAEPEVVRLLTAAGAEINNRSPDGSFPLHKAVLAKDAKRVTAFLEAGANPHVRNAEGDTPLHLAATRADTALVSLLVNAGADWEARNNEGATALEVARRHVNPPVGRKLLELGADPGFQGVGWIDDPPCDITTTLLREAPPESLQDCLETGVHLDRPIDFDRDPLLNLAETGRRERAAPEKIALLLEAGADPNTRDRDANTPLHLVARGVAARAEIAATTLLAAGADVNAPNSEGRTPLHNAVGSPPMMLLLLQAGADLNARTHLGETPLHMAADRVRNSAGITTLVEAGAELDARTIDGRTPLHVARQTHRPAAVRKLLEFGADPSARDAAGNLADPTACEHWQSTTFFAVAGVDDVAGCLEAGADPRPAPGSEDGNWSRVLHLALVHARDPAVVTTLVQAGADVHARDGFRYTPLHKAAENGTPAVVRALLQAGADPHARPRRFDEGIGVVLQSRGGRTPLHSAASNPNPDVAAVLLETGTDVSARGARWGDTPLHLAARNHNPEVARLLLEAGANVNARYFDGITPLHEAAALNPNPAVLAVLLEAGADPNARGERDDCAHWGWSGSLTPLHDAARINRNPEIVEVLVAAGADVDGRGAHMRSSCGPSPATHVSPLYMAVRYDGHPAMIEALVRAGADLELTDPDGRTVLHWAAIGYPFVFPQLLRLGADPETRDAEGKTPMDYARENAALRPWKKVTMSTPLDKT